MKPKPTFENRLPLTENQRKVYDFIVKEQASFGFPPTAQEIQKAMGYASPYAVTCKLRAIEKKGWLLIHPGAARGIQILEKYPLPKRKGR